MNKIIRKKYNREMNARTNNNESPNNDENAIKEHQNHDEDAIIYVGEVKDSDLNLRFLRKIYRMNQFMVQTMKNDEASKENMYSQVEITDNLIKIHKKKEKQYHIKETVDNIEITFTEDYIKKSNEDDKKTNDGGDKLEETTESEKQEDTTENQKQDKRNEGNQQKEPTESDEQEENTGSEKQDVTNDNGINLEEQRRTQEILDLAMAYSKQNFDLLKAQDLLQQQAQQQMIQDQIKQNQLKQIQLKQQQALKKRTAQQQKQQACNLQIRCQEDPKPNLGSNYSNNMNVNIQMPSVVKNYNYSTNNMSPQENANQLLRTQNFYNSNYNASEQTQQHVSTMTNYASNTLPVHAQQHVSTMTNYASNTLPVHAQQHVSTMTNYTSNTLPAQTQHHVSTMTNYASNTLPVQSQQVLPMTKYASNMTNPQAKQVASVADCTYTRAIHQTPNTYRHHPYMPSISSHNYIGCSGQSQMNNYHNQGQAYSHSTPLRRYDAKINTM